jgi:hypothetical protein
MTKENADALEPFRILLHKTGKYNKVYTILCKKEYYMNESCYDDGPAPPVSADTFPIERESWSPMVTTLIP